MGELDPTTYTPFVTWTGRYFESQCRWCERSFLGDRQVDVVQQVTEHLSVHRAEHARAAFVERWRAEHPEYIWPEGWTCPLCLRVIQESDQAWRDRVTRDHQREHGASWLAYEALAAAQDR